ncbi:MAG TPA: farnesyl diphosphate synthase [Longimicrobiales bacterium]|nr:farnesyl diphosphate synthase [Longimicrobiales bacterium]
MTTGTLDGAAVQRHLEQQRGIVDAALADIAAGIGGDDVVSRAVRYALAAGGKRLRPVLCLVAMEALHTHPLTRHHVHAAAAIELVHTYSLVHDDLPCMDDDDLRRGRPTVHRVFGSHAAIAAGFALIPLACRVLADAARNAGLDSAVAATAVQELCDGAGAAGMVGGQVLDLEAEGRALAVAELRRVHAMKTGALFAAAMRIGAVLAGGTAAERAALGSYGARLGLAFQIRDDVLDVTTDAAALGKTPGKDAGAAKATFAALLGVAAADAAAHAEADAAIAALADARIHHPLLAGLARFAAARSR